MVCATDAIVSYAKSSLPPTMAIRSSPTADRHSHSLKKQASVLLCNLAGATAPTTHKLLGHNHKVMQKLNTRLASTRQRYVIKVQDKIIFGNGKTWKDAEGDEAVLAKKVDPNSTNDEKNTS